jgi:MFS family permease
MFFFHERARKINIWAFSFLLGPYLAPFLSGFILQGFKGDWVMTFGMLCALYGLSVLMVIFLGDETLYSRDGVNKPREKGIVAKIKLLTGITGLQSTQGRPGLWEVTKDLFGLLTRPYLLIPGFFVTIMTCWTIGNLLGFYTLFT